MNNQQAINLLKGLEKNLDDYCELNDEGKTAFGMAITALELFGNSEQLPSIQPDTTTHDSIPAENGRNDGDGTSGDCISRMQAIDEIHEDADWLAAQGSDWQTERMERDKSILMSLPPIQPNHNAEVSKMVIVHCEDCEHWDTSWETVYGLHYCPMIDMSTGKNFFCKYGTEKRGEEDETN